MKRQNILVILALLAACYYLVLLRFPQKEHFPSPSSEEKKAALQLELRIQQLNDLLQAIIQANLARRTVEEEKPQDGLIQKLQEVTAQKEALGQELIQAKANLALVQPIKQKGNTADKSRIESLSKQLKEKEDTLAALKRQLNEEKANRQAASRNFNRISEELKIVKNAKSALEGALSETEKEKDGLKITNASLKDEIRAAGLGTEKLRKEIEQLRAELELLNKANSDLQNEYIRGQEVLKENEIESGKRADRILVLQEKLAKAEVQLADTQLKYTGMEKESALGREQNVAVQLEREELKNQLEQTRLRLSELENQTMQISNILNTAKTREAPAQAKEETKRVEVELVPAETIVQEAGK